MRDYSKIKDQMKRALVLHFKHGVPVDDIDINQRGKDIINRLDFIYPAYLEHPDREIYSTILEMTQLRCKDGFDGGYNIARLLAVREECMLCYVLLQLGQPLPPEPATINIGMPVKPKPEKPKPVKVKVEKPKPVKEKKVKVPKPVKVKPPKPVKVKPPKPVKEKKVKAPKPVKVKPPKPEPLPEVSLVGTPIYFLRLKNFCKEYALNEQSFLAVISGNAADRKNAYGSLAVFYFLTELADRLRTMAIRKESRKETTDGLKAMNQFIDMEILSEEMFHHGMAFKEWRDARKTTDEIRLINEMLTVELPERIENFVEQYSKTA